MELHTDSTAFYWMNMKMDKSPMVFRFLILCVLLVCKQTNADVLAVGLMKNMAILEVQGEKVILKSGQTKAGVQLISASSKEAEIVYNGQRQILGLGTSLASEYSAPVVKSVRIPKGLRGQYYTSVKVNGRSVKMLVDTGASSVAMSSRTAKSLGINYRQGTKQRSATASGIVPSFSFKLDSVQIGGIKRYGVRASVIEGNHPSQPLLGMSFLSSLKISDEEGMMVLTEK